MHSNGWHEIIGQDRAKLVLQKAIATGTVGHAYLFWGNDGIGKEAIAVEFARALLCEKGKGAACNDCQHCKKSIGLHHPNIKLIFPLPGGENKKNDDENVVESGLIEEIRRQTNLKAENLYYKIEIPKAQFIRINSIRQIKKEASLTTAESGKRIFILFDADRMNDASSNALLKVLEEPLENTHFLIVTSRKEKLKETVISRCQKIHCSPLQDSEIHQALVDRFSVTSDEATIITKLSGGSFRAALDFLQQDILQTRNEAIELLRSALSPSPAKFFTEFEEYFYSQNRSHVQHILVALLGFLRDASLLKVNAHELIMNADKETELKNFLSKFGDSDLEQCLLHVEEALGLLQRNVYLPLVFLSVVVQLKHTLNNVSQH